MTIMLRHYINVLVNNAGITTGSLITDPNNAATCEPFWTPIYWDSCGVPAKPSDRSRRATSPMAMWSSLTASWVTKFPCCPTSTSKCIIF